MNQRPSPILDAGVAIATGPILVFSLYLLAAGHNRPGGGFAGGLVAGTAVVLAWATGGTRLVRRYLPLRSSILMGVGLAVATVTGFIPLLLGGSFLESGSIELALPIFGDVKAVSALVFDIGVYLIIVGMSLGLVRALGEDGS